MKVAVRSLCEFAARRGSLDFRYTPSPTALEGMLGHSRVQARRPEPYVAEYSLSGEFEGIHLNGRVDGYYAGKKSAYLEEIKTHRGDVKRIGAGPRGLHWAQLKVYGALLCQRDKRDSICLKLTYFEVTKEREHSEEVEYSAKDLYQFSRRLCARYALWAKAEANHREVRDQALLALKFPFDGFRHGQRALAETVFKAASTGRHLLLQAPTGIGKTVGVLYPAMVAMPRQNLDRLFFLTARNTGRQLALDALETIAAAQGGPAPLRIVELCAKDHACQHPDLACHGESCPLANGFFDRLDKAREDAVQQAFLDRNAINAIALKHTICPYFLGQEMARWADISIGDVNHYFDQQALLHALTVQNEWQVLPLIDEAHNLIDRARGMYSLTLAEKPFLAARKRAPNPVKRALSKVKKAWLELCEEYFPHRQQTTSDGCDALHYLENLPDHLNLSLQGLIKSIIDYLSDHPGDAELQNLLFDAAGFLRLAEVFDQHSVAILSYTVDLNGEHFQPGTARLSIENLIPADHISPRFNDAHSSVLFSATLSPAHYYSDLLGLPEDSHWQDIASPFHRGQLDLRIVPQISTRLARREASLQPITQRIANQYRQRPGNYLIYLSSFAYLDSLYQVCQHHYPELPLLRQRAGMSQQQRDDFIGRFRSGEHCIGFAVLGGVFSEGIDLPGDQLIGVFVATLGLPPFNPFQELLCQRLEQRFGDGYRYTYLYPGLRKVVQAAGRLIRRPEDRGIIELIDDRFANPDVSALLPAWWRDE